MEGNDVVLMVDFSRFMTSSGCSNILSDRLNCFRGRINGFEFFLTCPPTGDPLRTLPARPARGCLGRGGPIKGLAEGVGRSGDSAKISESVIDEDDVSLETPLPNLKGGRRLSAEDFCGMLLVDRPLARARPGRIKVGFFRLCSCQHYSLVP